ncbi:DUF7935 family protein [Sphingobacterium bambusae]|nr:hypothetical protein [Sphingobacterium bambusae]WPL50323.1 hypothetical protein SCB77_07660 [Sphingobacterium bambusae]
MISMVSKEFVEFFTQVFAFALGGLAAVVVGFKLLWPRVESFQFKLHMMQRNRAEDREIRQLKFAAYERLLVLVHRMEPIQVLVRQHQEELTLATFVSRAIQDVEAEYQHNFTQQLYVSDVAWQAVTDLKKSTVSLLRRVLETEAGEPLVDQYVAQVLKQVREVEVNPYEAVQQQLKREMYL